MKKKNIFKKLSKILGIKQSDINNILIKNTLNKSLNIKKIFIRKNSQLNFILTNTKLYINYNKKIPLVIKQFLKKIFLIIDKSYYKILFNFKPKKN